MKHKKTEYTFKPFDSKEWLHVSEKDVIKVLDKEQFDALNKKKIYNVGAGTFKMG